MIVINDINEMIIINEKWRKILMKKILMKKWRRRKYWRRRK